jgi:hypothetical protein
MLWYLVKHRAATSLTAPCHSSQALVYNNQIAYKIMIFFLIKTEFYMYTTELHNNKKLQERKHNLTFYC